MHIINRLFLKFALFPRLLYTRLGVNVTQLESILTTKLILDDRRPRSVMQGTGGKEKKPPSMATLSTMLLSAVMGVVFLVFLFMGSDMVTRLTLYFSLFFVLLSLTLITDFTSVLIDVRDNFILLPKPVNDKTIVVARLLHIFIHLCKIVLPMCLPGLIYLGNSKGLYGALLFLLLIFLLSAFSIFFINAVYIGILKFTTPRRFQAIITYVQIVFAITIYGGYQLVPRLMSGFVSGNFSVESISWINALPLYWLAQSWNLLYTFSGSPAAVSTGVAGILFPLLCMAVVVKYLAPSFNRKLSLLSASDSGAKKAVVRKSKKEKTAAVFFSRLVTVNAVEKASFVFTWKMTARSREFKLKVYPSMGYVAVYAAYLFFSNKNLQLSQLADASGAGKWMVLSVLYLSVFLLSMAIGQVVYSDKYKASWIFYTSPVAQPGRLVTGMAKAVLLKFYFPIVAVIFALAIPFGGIGIVPNLLLGVSNVVLIVAVLLYTGKHYFPFSALQSTNAKTGSFLQSIFVFAIAGLIAFGHFIVYGLLPVVMLCTALSMGAVWLLFDSLGKTEWAKILQSSAEG